MTPLASYVLSLALTHFAPGQSGQSLVEVPGCGTDPAHPTCKLERLCPNASDATCNPPKFVKCFHGWRVARHRKGQPEPTCHPTTSAAPGAFARLETRDEGAKRFEVIAEAIADVAEEHAKEWPLGAADLARAMLSASGWSTGLHERIETGELRGPAGEVCLTDMQLPTLRTVVPPELARLSDDDLVKAVVGTDYEHLVHCYDAGATLLVRTRKYASTHCRQYPLSYSMFAVYAMGASCTTAGKFGDLAGFRDRSYRAFQATPQTVFPKWYTPEVPRVASGVVE